MIKKIIFTFLLSILPFLLNANDNISIENNYKLYQSEIRFNKDGLLEKIKNESYSNLIKPVSNDGEDLLLLSIKYKRNDIFKELIKKGLNVNSVVNDIPYLTHILKHDIDLLDFVLKEKGNYILYINKSGDTLLNQETGILDFNVLKKLLDEINPIENLSSFEHLNDKKMSFLHYLVKNNNVDALKYLKEKFNYKIKNIQDYLLKYSYDTNIETFKHVVALLDDTHFNTFFIKNKNNIISHIFKDTSNDFINSSKQKTSIDAIFEHLNKNNKLQFFFSKDDSGLTFFHHTIKSKNNILVNKFKSENIKIPLPNTIFSFALKNDFKDFNTITDIITSFNIGESFNEILKDDSSSKKILPYLEKINLSSLEKPIDQNKEHFILTALKNERLDFITKLLKLKKNIVFPDIFLNSLTKKYPSFSISLFNSNILIPKNIQRKELLYNNLTNQYIDKKSKVNYIYDFIKKNIFSHNDFKEIFYSNNKFNITNFELISYLFPNNDIISHIKSLKTYIKAKPFKSIDEKTLIDSFYINDFFKTNNFGTSILEYSVLTNYKYISDIYNLMDLNDFLIKGKNGLNIIQFSKKHNPAEFNNIKRFLLNKFNYSISSEILDKDSDLSNTNVAISFSNDDLLLSILNNDKIIIDKNNIDFYNFILPSYLYNKENFEKIPNKSLVKYKKQLINEFIITDDSHSLDTFLQTNKIKLTNNKSLGRFAVSHNSKDCLDLLLNDYFINSNFHYLNGLSPHHNFLFSSYFEKTKKLIKNNNANIFLPLIYHNQLETINHIKESLDLDLHKSLYKQIYKNVDNSNLINNLFISEYDKIIANDDIEKLLSFLKNGFLIKDYPLLANIISFNENRTRMFQKLIYFQNDNNKLSKEYINNTIFELFTNNRNNYLNNLNIKIFKNIINDKNFFSSLFFELKNYKQRDSFIQYFSDNKIKLDFFNLEKLVDSNFYDSSMKLLNNNMILLEQKSIEYKNFLDKLSSSEDNLGNLKFFKFFINKYIKDKSINFNLLKKSLLKKDKFIFLLKRSTLSIKEYSDLFDLTLTNNPNEFIIDALLNHKIAKDIPLNRSLENSHILEHYLINNFDDKFSSTLKNIFKDITKESTLNILKKLSSLNKIELFKNNITIFKELIKTHNINSFEIFLNDNSIEFIREVITNQINTNAEINNENNIFPLFKNKDIADITKLELFELYKSHKLNILSIDSNNKSIFEYLVDLGISESNIINLLNKIELKTRINFIAKHNLFNYILNNKYSYDNLINSYLNNNSLINFKNTIEVEEFSLLVIKHKKEILFKNLLKSNFNFNAVNKNSQLRAFDYAILSNNTTFIYPFLKNGYFISDDDINFAITNNASKEIIDYLQEKSQPLFWALTFFHIAQDHLSIVLPILSLLFGFILFRRFIKKNLNSSLIEKELTDKELELQSLHNKIKDIDYNESFEIEDDLLAEINSEFDSIKEQKNNDRELLSELKSPFSKKESKDNNESCINSLNKEISSIDDKDYAISNDLLDELNNDFGQLENDDNNEK